MPAKKRYTIMTPKEKAKQLVFKYEQHKWISHELAKTCALIAVNEIIESKPTSPFNATNPYSDNIDMAAIYWEEVKIEIDYL